MNTVNRSIASIIIVVWNTFFDSHQFLLLEKTFYSNDSSHLGAHVFQNCFMRRAGKLHSKSKSLLLRLLFIPGISFVLHLV